MILKFNLSKSRSKAMRTAVGVDGVDSASLPADKDQIVVTGNDVDVVLLATLQRKSVKHVEVVSVSPVKEEEKKKKEEKEHKLEQIIVGRPQTYPVASYQYPYQYQCYEPCPSNNCSIM